LTLGVAGRKTDGKDKKENRSSIQLSSRYEGSEIKIIHTKQQGEHLDEDTVRRDSGKDHKRCGLIYGRHSLADNRGHTVLLMKKNKRDAHAADNKTPDYFQTISALLPVPEI